MNPVRHFSRFAPIAIMSAFVVGCLFTIRADVAQMSFDVLVRRWDLVASAMLLSSLNYAVRIIRWRAYLARLGHPLGRRFAALTYCAGFAYTLSPGKLGEMVRAKYYRPLGVPFSTVAAGFFMERLMDLLAMIALASLVFAVAPRYRGVIIVAAALVVLALATMTLVPWPEVKVKLASNQFPRWLRIPLASLTEALVAARSLLSPGVIVAGFAAGLLAWGAEGVGLGLLSSMFPRAADGLASSVGIYGMAVLVGGLSFLPGGLGSTEAVMTALLTTADYPVSQALLITLTCRLVTLWFAVALGWIAVLALRRKPILAVSI